MSAVRDGGGRQAGPCTLHGNGNIFPAKILQQKTDLLFVFWKRNTVPSPTLRDSSRRYSRLLLAKEPDHFLHGTTLL
jgi:hypothetical protein